MNNIKQIELTSVRKEDYEDIVIFLSNFQGEGRGKVFWENRLLFWWDNNPAFSDNFKRGWILKDTDKLKIVGFIANIPTFFIYEGKKIVVNNASTWRVEKEYRNLSIKLFLSLINYYKDTILFDTTPSNNVEEILKLLKFNKFPNHKNHIFFIPIRLNRIYKHRYGKNIILINLLKLINLLFKGFYNNTIFNRLNYKTYKVKQIKNIDDRFDKLWAKSKNSYLNTNVRDSKYLKWYCNMMPNMTKVIFGYFENATLNNFAIFQIIYERKIKSLHCRDIWGLKINLDALKAIINEVLKFSYKNDIDIIYFPHINDEIDTIYKKLRLIKKEYNDKRFYKSKNKFLNHTELKDTYLTLAQGDMGL